MTEGKPGVLRRVVRRIPVLSVVGVLAIALAVGAIAWSNLRSQPASSLLNVSYSATDEVYQAINKAFAEDYQRENGTSVTVETSNGGSGRQASAVVDGTERAGVVSLALPSDVETLVKRGFVDSDWQSRLPNNSAPYTSTVVFLVRKGNPKAIDDWPDLVKADVGIVSPDPASSGVGRLALLAAWGSVTTRGGTAEQARQYLTQLYAHVARFDVSARVATNTFVIDQLGDVQLAWESEAIRDVKNANGDLEIVYPPVSILAEPPVTLVDKNLDDATEPIAEAYLQYLYSDAAQETYAQLGFRPRNEDVLARHADLFPTIELFPITAIAKDWNDAQTNFFGADGVVETISAAQAKPGS
ncbi:MAG: sulfate ABC transporter substrate-binding protein [Micropruina sp.]|uniref:sulfate ABC transporter substrate-binding protein n=1 Tax=Micropruina sp. TaxID=2737536 RepID=UPI0039E68CD9